MLRISGAEADHVGENDHDKGERDVALRDVQILVPNIASTMAAVGAALPDRTSIHHAAFGTHCDGLSPDVLATRAGAMLTLVAKPLLDATSLPTCYVNAACWITYNIEWFCGADIHEPGEIRMPAQTDMPRQWVSEGDFTDAFVRILTDTPSAHVGRSIWLPAENDTAMPTWRE